MADRKTPAKKMNAVSPRRMRGVGPHRVQKQDGQLTPGGLGQPVGLDYSIWLVESFRAEIIPE